MSEWAFKVDMLGKIRNNRSFKNNALLPLYEAIVNSICSIQRSDSRPLIQVNIGNSAGIDGTSIIEDIEIVDFGAGFNDENLESFLQSDSTFNQTYGCKGVGRFTWLCAFDHVHIKSVYIGKDNKKYLREFTFSAIKPYCHPIVDEQSTNESVGTLVKLCGFKNEYKRLPTAYKKTETIADKIVVHCFGYFISMPDLEILVHDSGGTVSCRDCISKYSISDTSEEVLVGKEQFFIKHIKTPEGSLDSKHQIVFTANNRVVTRYPLEQLGKRPFSDNSYDFYYMAIVSSPYLDDHVNSDRSSFDIDLDETLDPNTELTVQQIKKHLQPAIESFLNIYLEKNKNEKKQLVDSYTLLFPEYKEFCKKNVDDIIAELKGPASLEEINKIVSLKKSESELKLRNDVKKIASSVKTSKYLDLNDQIENLLTTIDSSNREDLVKSVIRRSLVLQLLDKKLKVSSQEPNKYPKEDVIHDILFHRRSYSDELSTDDLNLWIIDERLLYHSFAASDVELSKYLAESDSEKRPDITIAFTKSNSRKVESICILELKRPMRKDKYCSPIDQILTYVKKIRGQKALTHEGRFFNTTQDTMFYCYAVCDITETVKDDADNHNMQLLPDEMGYYMYHSNHRAYIEILSYDKILSRAYMNNHYMFSKLGLPLPSEFELSTKEFVK